MPGPGARNFAPPGHGMGPRMEMPRMEGPPDHRMDVPPGPMYEGYGSRIDSPKFDGFRLNKIMEVVLNNILKIIYMYNIVFSSIISSTNKTDRHDTNFISVLLNELLNFTFIFRNANGEPSGWCEVS
jgi:hypothetical protein